MTSGDSPANPDPATGGNDQYQHLHRQRRWSYGPAVEELRENLGVNGYATVALGVRYRQRCQMLITIWKIAPDEYNPVAENVWRQMHSVGVLIQHLLRQKRHKGFRVCS